MIASNPDPYNTPDVKVSPLSVHTLFPNKKVPIGLWWELWFRKGGSHLYPGFDSNDPATVAAQVASTKAQGYDFAVLDWYGTAIEPQQSASLLWKPECEKQGLKFAIDFDKGMFQWNVPAGMTMEAWGQQQMAYVVKTFCSSPAYMKTRDGRFLMFNFDCPTLVDMSKIMAPYPQIAMLYWKKDGISKPYSAGCYSWVGYDAVNPVGCIERNLNDFLAAAAKAQAAKPSTIIVPSLCGFMDDHDRTGKPGHDPTKSCWDQTKPARIVPWQQGQVLLNAARIIDQTQVDIECVIAVTADDFEENTALWRGVDAQVAVSLSAVQGVLTAALTGNLNAVDRVAFIVNGAVVSLQPAALSLSYDLSSLLPASGTEQFTCEAVPAMKALFQIPDPSNTVTVTATIVPPQTRQFLYSGTVQVGIAPVIDVDVPEQTISLAISTVARGLNVQGSLDVDLPATKAQAAVNPVQSVTVQSQPVTVNITEKKTIWS